MDICPGPNITHYLIQFSFQNGSVVDTENVNNTECTAERCSDTFELPSNPPSSYDSVSVAAENMVGVGDVRTCTAQTISESYSRTVINPRRAHAQRGLQYLVCVSVCLCVCRYSTSYFSRDYLCHKRY